MRVARDMLLPFSMLARLLRDTPADFAKSFWLTFFSNLNLRNCSPIRLSIALSVEEYKSIMIGFAIIDSVKVVIIIGFTIVRLTKIVLYKQN